MKRKGLVSQLRLYGFAALAIALFATSPDEARFTTYLKHKGYFTFFVSNKRENLYLFSVYNIAGEDDKLYLGILNNIVSVPK